MPIAKCRICRAQFYAKPFWIKRGYGKYCSSECMHKGRKTGRNVQCFICQKTTYKTQKALNHSKSKKYFCSKSCQAVWRNSVVFIGKNHPNWKSGKYTYRGIMLRSRTPQICKLCKTEDKRVLAVHHLDENHQNNRLKNLVWLCHNCHVLVHHYEAEKKRLMVPIA